MEPCQTSLVTIQACNAIVTSKDNHQILQTRCCIAGGGPAGIMLGLLLARAGVDVVVLEKHADFLRDFRGDTIHPSTLEVMHELGILDDFLKRPHQKVHHLSAFVGGIEVPIADFSRLPVRCRFIAFMPQWEFLDFIAEQAKRFPTFDLRMNAEVTGLVNNNNGIAGVRAAVPGGTLEVRADLTVGADGRHSAVRKLGGLTVDDLGAPMDVLWMKLSRRADDPDQPRAYFMPGKIFIMIYREDYWQCGYVIPKGEFDVIRERGLESLHSDIAGIDPMLSDRVTELNTWDNIRLLTVTVNRLRSWYLPGLLCIGDAAHAMSPIGGVGINLAIQDAVAAANQLAVLLHESRLTINDLRKVQRRRLLPTRLTQRLQVIMQNRVIKRVIGRVDNLAPAWPLKLLRRYPALRRIPARAIGMGFRPEHVTITGKVQ